MNAQTWTLKTTIDGPEDAPVLVLGHSLGSSHVMWDEVVAALADRVRVIRYDLPGHGGSAPAPLDRPMTMADVTAALTRTLADLGVERYHLAGLSFGGLTTLAMGTAAPAGLESIAVFGSGPVTAPLEQWPERAALVREQGAEGLIEATFERWFTKDARTEHADVWQRVRDAFAGCDREGYAQACEVLGSTDLSDDVAAIAVPTLLVAAENDGALNYDTAEPLARTIGAGATPVEVVRLADVKHMSAVERPREVAVALARHIGVDA
ncbi:alpha/beta fold hydrolase [Nanchangia anserum]|uniref:Alpha/beta fold hydrolase n=1 Tax=Nanchangia anserum TaxID=2692125 RepID=A0A8I0GAL2_9ACTO|nr:alpha/beta fold hydrolase [Nanchangia anserum]MBD3689278.1 alpha/beta fold hydrolase [Nanchangia anserum]QOX81497.1 alpha/beta fold hydrolase [Nanchangia anserum]